MTEEHSLATLASIPNLHLKIDLLTRSRQSASYRLLRAWRRPAGRPLPMRVRHGVGYDFVYVDQESFEIYSSTSFENLMDGFREYKE